MHDQPRYDPFAASPAFADGRAMRKPPAHTVSREAPVDVEVFTGRRVDGQGWTAEIPAAVIREARGMQSLLERGQERYNISCTPCHGYDGVGKGAAVLKAKVAALQPPSLHEARLRRMPDGQLFATITHGIRNMPAYGHSVSNADRWAIVAYVRALQLHQSGQGPNLRQRKVNQPKENE
ncbi:MAG: c-type cytochrome [Polyangiales bacterium]